MKKEYRFFKTAAKTAKENNLVIVKNGADARLFNFSALDNIGIPDEEKEEHAMKYVSAAWCESFYGQEFSNFHWCVGTADYAKQKVFSCQTGKRLYTIFAIAKIDHKSCHRESIYDDAEVEEFKFDYINSDYEDVEI